MRKRGPSWFLELLIVVLLSWLLTAVVYMDGVEPAVRRTVELVRLIWRLTIE